LEGEVVGDCAERRILIEEMVQNEESMMKGMVQNWKGSLVLHRRKPHIGLGMTGGD
jgi:hypothetical protein